jgi:hypothetical protein
MRVIQHTTSLRPHIWLQRFFWSKAGFVGNAAGFWLLVAHATGTTDALALEPRLPSAHRTT